jgi:hypothetical protein
LPQYFGPKNTGEDCELADKKKNDNRVLHDFNNSLSGKLRICPTETFTASGAVHSNSLGSFVGCSISSTGIIGSAARIVPGRQDRAITASTIKNVSMTYVPRDMSLCLFLSRRGCSKLLTIDNKWRGFTPRSY